MPDAVVLGESIYRLERPENAVRWVIRNTGPVLQQCWSVTAIEGGTTYAHQEWRDVPTEREDAP